MMKKYIALGVALVLLLTLTACGNKEDNNPTKDPVTTTTTIAGDATDGTTVNDTAAEGTTVTDGDGTATRLPVSTTVVQDPTADAPTTEYVPGGATVAIGTKPATTTTTQKTTAATGGATAGNSTTTSAPATTTSAAKPTDPPANQHYIALPEIGTDIDVTKKKDRIRVSDAQAWYNADGTIGVSLTFKNYTSNWITEETDYVQYTCYDENGKELETDKIMIGVIDTKKYPTKTFTFNVPAETYEVRLTKSKIVYWTEWA